MLIKIGISGVQESSWSIWLYSLTVAATASPFVNGTDALPIIDTRSTFFGDQCNSNSDGNFHTSYCIRGQSFFT
jgi:hypothetical protein